MDEKENGFIVEPGVWSSAPPIGDDECCSKMPIEVSNGWAVTTWELLPSEMDRESMGLEETYITLKFLQPDFDLLNVVANTTNHGLKRPISEASERLGVSYTEK